jgi:hypothetical protein
MASKKQDTVGTGDEPVSEYRQRVEAANRKLIRRQAEVGKALADELHAKGVRKKAEGSRDRAVMDLQKVIDGQLPLPGMENAGEDSAPVATGADAPVSELGAKLLKATIGDDVFQAAKDRGEPVGLTAAVLEKLEAADIKTIAGLEAHMRETRDWWLTLAKSQDADAVRRAVDSLREYRVVHPHDEQPQPVEQADEAAKE